MGASMSVNFLVDASAALGITSPRGSGKVMHLGIDSLWIQEMSATKRVNYDKASGGNNPADMMIKDLS